MAVALGPGSSYQISYKFTYEGTPFVLVPGMFFKSNGPALPRPKFEWDLTLRGMGTHWDIKGLADLSDPLSRHGDNLRDPRYF